MRISCEIKRLEHALRVLAKIVALHGDVYLPLFERIEKELLAVKKQEELRQRALNLASMKDNSHEGPSHKR
ncbi:MAG: hypothetical protein JJ964_12050 [Rhizobiales bacterium]|nr:hypothetical protein [Hyphomicrobiales bacterium]